MSEKDDYIIFCENLIKIYKTKDIEVLALQGLDFKVEKGEFMAIIGNSGSGKTTLLNMLGGLDRPTIGKIFVDGKDLFKMSGSQLMRYKLGTVGFVWQNNARNLIPYLTALENVEFPMIIAGSSKRRERAKQLLEAVGLRSRMNSKLSQLSGGELQRAAISIAMANNPKILMADEPTGSVDSKTTDNILDVFREVNKSFGVTVIIVTHDRQVSRKVDRVVSISDGRTSSEFIRKDPYFEPEKLFTVNNSSEAENEEIDTHIELAIVDRTRRLQIPSEFLDELKLGKESMVRISMAGENIVISSPKAFLNNKQKVSGTGL
jgi:ABC-type lipoprotein export system ATPase subunit